jgi:hypothetical protein
VNTQPVKEVNTVEVTEPVNTESVNTVDQTSVEVTEPVNTEPSN